MSIVLLNTTVYNATVNASVIMNSLNNATVLYRPGITDLDVIQFLCSSYDTYHFILLGQLWLFLIAKYFVVKYSRRHKEEQAYERTIRILDDTFDVGAFIITVQYTLLLWASTHSVSIGQFILVHSPF